MRLAAIIALLFVLTAMAGFSRAAWELGRHGSAVVLWAVSVVVCLAIAVAMDCERRRGQ
jgi:hypothetical protein